MGFWQEFFSDLDKPALAITWAHFEDDSEELRLVKEENRKLRLMVKKLLERGIHEQKRKEIDFDDF